MRSLLIFLFVLSTSAYGYLTPTGGNGASTSLDNLTTTSVNQNLVFDNNGNYTVKPVDLNTPSGSAKVFRIQGQDNTNVGSGAPAGELHLMAGGSPNGFAPHVYIGNHYNGPDVQGPGDYIFISTGEVFGATVGLGTLGTRFYNPDSATGPSLPGSDYWQIAVNQAHMYFFGNVDTPDILNVGDHGVGIPTFRHLMVFDGTPAAAFNGDVANASLDSYLGSQNTSGVQPFLGAYVGAVGVGYSSGDSRTSVPVNSITKKSGTGTLTIGADIVQIGAASTTHQNALNNATAAASNCGSLAGAAGCIQLTINGSTHYVPYF